MPSDMISVILQQHEIILILSWSTIRIFHCPFTDRITSFKISEKGKSDKTYIFAVLGRKIKSCNMEGLPRQRYTPIFGTKLWVIVLGDGGYRGTGYVMAHQLFKLYPLHTPWPSQGNQCATNWHVLGGVTTWAAEEPLHNLYRGSHRRQVRSVTFPPGWVAVHGLVTDKTWHCLSHFNVRWFTLTIENKMK